MQCSECGAEITSSDIYPNVYGFIFCDPTTTPIDQEACEDIFERKLWEQAQANQQAKQKAASETSEAGGSQGEMVAGVTSEWQAP